MPETTRAQLVELIRPYVGRSWAIQPHEATGATIDKPTLTVSQQTIRRHPNLPQGKLLVSFTLRMAVPSQDVAGREDDLDEDMVLLLFGLDSIPGLAWDEAQKVLDAGKYLAYDVTATLVVDKPKPPTPNIIKRKRY